MGPAASNSACFPAPRPLRWLLTNWPTPKRRMTLYRAFWPRLQRLLEARHGLRPMEWPRASWCTSWDFRMPSPAHGNAQQLLP